MYCPRCGRPVSDNANFCGGCGLPRAEILKYSRNAASDNNRQKAEENNNVLNEEKLNDDSFSQSADTQETRQTSQNNYTGDYSTNQNNYSSNTYSNYNQNYNNGTSGNDYYAGGYEKYEKVESVDPLTVVDYLWMMIISGIPIVGIVYMLYTAFAGQNTNKKNWARAMLILAVFGSILAFVFIFGVVSAASII